MSTESEATPGYQTRKCVRCKNRFEWDGSPYKKHCLDCYKAVVRSCNECGGGIRLDAQKWVKICTTCWQEKRAKTHTTCPTCPEEKSSHLRRRWSQPACDDCMKKNPKFFLKRPEEDKEGEKEEEEEEEEEEGSTEDGSDCPPTPPSPKKTPSKKRKPETSVKIQSPKKPVKGS